MFKENTVHPNIYIFSLVSGLILGIQGNIYITCLFFIVFKFISFLETFQIKSIFFKIYQSKYLFSEMLEQILEDVAKNNLDMINLYVHIPWLYADYCTCGYTEAWLNMCIACCWFAINIKLISTFTFFISKKLNHFFLSSESIVN